MHIWVPYIQSLIELHEQENYFYSENYEDKETDHLLQTIQASHSEQSLSWYSVDFI